MINEVIKLTRTTSGVSIATYILTRNIVRFHRSTSHPITQINFIADDSSISVIETPEEIVELMYAKIH